ncbi:MAG: hypothetical protein N5P05_003833 [Chroococcopsis gigantea SAG 12.99]|jgi:hypothetical protein|nr:DUF4359 domain-containing protein [Chlorogloea purpurea SAG 13.99]MDV3002227.1 hypothetical protein [Chroococcopsis gigantea SAG 12.99]
MKGSNLVVPGIVLGVLAAVMAASNPQPTNYVDYASDRFIAEAEKVVCDRTGYCDIDKMPVIGKNTIKNNLLKPAIENSTKRDNMGLFSIYTTEFPGVVTVKTLGVFGNFITYQQSKS